MSVALSQLVKVKSRHAESCLAWLGAIDAVLSKQPLLERFGRSLDDAGLRIALQVEPFDVARFRDRAEQEKRERENLLPRMDNLDDERRIYAHRGSNDDDQRDKRSKAEPLDPLLDSLEVAMLLGDPGSGKSECLKGLAVRLARERQVALQSHALLSDDICLPVFAELPTVAELFGRKLAIPIELNAFAKRWLALKLEDDETRLGTAILRAAIQRLGLDSDAGFAKCGGAIRKIWREWQAAAEAGQPRDSGAVLLLDAWDEIAERNRTDCFKNALHQFSQQPPARLLATSRIVGFETGVLQIPATTGPGAPRRELAVRPFRFEDCEAFIRAFFGQREHAEKLIADLRAKPMIFSMLQNPLLASLVCLVFDPDGPAPVPMPARRSAVYAAVVQRLLGDEEARRKTRTKLPGDVIREIASVFRALAFDLWPNDEIFDEDLLDAFCDSDRRPRIPALGKFLSKRDETLSQFLRECGLLTSHGEHGLKFLHLTFQEYFAGGWLAAAVEDGWSKAKIKVRDPDGEFHWIAVRTFVNRKAWDPRWREAIILFAGQIESVPVEPLLETLLAGEDDVLHHRLCVAAACLPELTGGALKNSARIAAEIASQVWNLWREEEGLRLAHPKALTWVASLNPSISEGSRTLLDRIFTDFFHGEKSVRECAERALKMVEGAAAFKAFLEELANCVRYYKYLYHLRDIFQHLGRSAAIPEMVDAFVDRLQTGALDSDTIKIVGALGSTLMGHPVVQESFGKALQVDDPFDWSSVSRTALGVLGHYRWNRLPREIFQGITRLIENIQEDNIRLGLTDLEHEFCFFEPHLANEHILQEIGRLVSSDRWYVRDLAVAILSRLRDGGANDGLLQMLQVQLLHTDPWVVRSAMEAIAAIGPKAATREICSSLRSAWDRQEDHFKADTIWLLRAIDAENKPEFLGALIDMVENAEEQAHWTTDLGRRAAEAISRLDLAGVDPKAAAKLSSLLEHSKRVVRSRAAQALSGTSLTEISGERLDSVIALIDDDDWLVDDGAKAFLKAFVHNSAYRGHILEELTKRLGSLTKNIREKAVDLLGAFGPAARESGVIEGLTQSLNDQSIAQHALRALAEIGPPSLTESTRTACKAVFEYPTFYGFARDVEALVKLGIKEVPKPFLRNLVEQLQRSDEEARKYAFETTKVLPRAETAKSGFLEDVANILAIPVHHPGYKVGFDEDDPNSDIPRKAREILTWFVDHVSEHPYVTATIAKLLANLEPGMRERGAYAVWAIGASAATDEVLDALANLLSHRNSPWWDPEAVGDALRGLKGAAQRSTKLLDAIADQLAATATPEREFIEMAKSLPSVRFFIVRGASWLPFFGTPQTRGRWENVDKLAGITVKTYAANPESLGSRRSPYHSSDMLI
jgi:HEAT repeat protein